MKIMWSRVQRHTNPCPEAARAPQGCPGLRNAVEESWPLLADTGSTLCQWHLPNAPPNQSLWGADWVGVGMCRICCVLSCIQTSFLVRILTKHLKRMLIKKQKNGKQLWDHASRKFWALLKLFCYTSVYHRIINLNKIWGKDALHRKMHAKCQAWQQKFVSTQYICWISCLWTPSGGIKVL